MRYLYFALVLLAGCPKKEPPKPAVDAAPVVTARVTELDRDEDAFAKVLEEDPAILAIGEAHAQRGATAASSAKRFTEELLPLLAGRASNLVVELMIPPGNCAKQTAEMKETQKPVVSQQAETNQNEYVLMGTEARKYGLMPDPLRPSCADLGAINDAGADAIEKSLETIARLTTDLVTRRLAHAGKKMVVTYGGALHNDATPPPERAAWAFGPALSKQVDGRYVELDLYVPDFITTDDTWKKQPWYPDWEAHKASGKALLVKLAPKNYVIVLSKK